MDRFVVVPSPSWPYWFDPFAHTVPFCRRARAKNVLPSVLRSMPLVIFTIGEGKTSSICVGVEVWFCPKTRAFAPSTVGVADWLAPFTVAVIVVVDPGEAQRLFRSKEVVAVPEESVVVVVGENTAPEGPANDTV
ncbi:hypothetical protein LPW41_12775 [Microbacterium sp. JC 701]|nr:hypothetical protein [Microbacterium sp. JC 701]MCD2170571.1 hypothetical protein [Microbacterium sp. JC 701]